jgi:hypothetical protein
MLATATGIIACCCRKKEKRGVLTYKIRKEKAGGS